MAAGNTNEKWLNVFLILVLPVFATLLLWINMRATQLRIPTIVDSEMYAWWGCVLLQGMINMPLDETFKVIDTIVKETGVTTSADRSVQL